MSNKAQTGLFREAFFFMGKRKKEEKEVGKKEESKCSPTGDGVHLIVVVVVVQLLTRV